MDRPKHRYFLTFSNLLLGILHTTKLDLPAVGPSSQTNSKVLNYKGWWNERASQQDAREQSAVCSAVCSALRVAVCVALCFSFCSADRATICTLLWDSLFHLVLLLWKITCIELLWLWKHFELILTAVKAVPFSVVPCRLVDLVLRGPIEMVAK